MAKDKDNKTQEITIPVNITLRESTIKAVLTAAKRGPGEEIESVKAAAEYFIGHYSDGGIMLTSQQAAYLRKIAGDGISTGQKIIELVEQTIGRESGGFTIKATIDSALIEPAKETASAQGRTVEELLTECVNIALQNGWLYQFSTSGGTVPLTDNHKNEIGRLIGMKVFTADDIVAALSRTVEKKAA